MKKTVSAATILLLLALTFPSISSIPKVSATITENLRHVTTVTDDIPREPVPDNYTTEDYLNTTNPYADYIGIEGALGEVDEPEGNHPLYVLVFGDEEERSTWRRVGEAFFDWKFWAKIQIERGDEALVANFGIDIRILDFLEWDSDDSIKYMDDPYEWDLCDELLADKGYYLRTWYDGEWWSSYVDAIIGITAQATPQTPDTIGVAPSLNELNQGAIFVLLKWQVYWMDDNIVQHEVSHLYYAPDHPEPQPPPCCAMAYHPHFQSFIWENGLWFVFDDIPCALTAYSWCANCCQTIQQNSGRYPLHTLTISASSGGTTDPAPGTYIYGNDDIVTVTAIPDPDCCLKYWVLDGEPYPYPIYLITFGMDSDRSLTAYFNHPPNIPSTPSGPTSGRTYLSYTYSTNTTDPDGDNVYYQFYWSDGSITTTGWYASNSTVSASHHWDSPGTYHVKVRAGDSYTQTLWSLPLYINIISSDEGGGCPTLFVWDGTSYVEEGVLNIHAESDVTVQHEIENALALEDGVYKLQLRELDNFTSHIDQVKLYAVDGEGKWHLCPLIYAYHNEIGKVTWKLLFDDGNRVDLKPTEIIDLKFASSIPYGETAYLIFEINGYNMKWPGDYP